MIGQITERLPGVGFEAEPKQKEGMPRMDVAVFVGFTSSGPIHIPVAVEDVAQFENIFGSEAPLAADGETSGTVYAYLPAAVRTFFKNGGVRCWIIRVAATGSDGRAIVCQKTARYNYFSVPGMARLTRENGKYTVAPAFAQARSEGSWSDALRIGTVLSPQILEVMADVGKGDGKSLDVLARSYNRRVAPGDLLRITFADGKILFLSAESVKSAAASPQQNAAFQHISGSNALLIEPLLPLNLPHDAQPVNVYLYAARCGHGCTPRPLAGLYGGDGEDYCMGWNRYDGQLGGKLDSQSELSLELSLPPEETPEPGSVIRLELEGQQVLMIVSRSVKSEGPESPPGKKIRLEGEAFRMIETIPDRLQNPASGEILTFALSANKGDDYTTSLQDLGFAPSQERYWGKMPVDHDYFDTQTGGSQAGQKEIRPEQEKTPFWIQANGGRFPFARHGKKTQTETIFCFPAGMQYLLRADQFQGPLKFPATPLERDGLASFGPELFLDAGLAEQGTDTLRAQADFLRYISPSPRSLIGIHAALQVEEATIISVPDAVHRGWHQISPPPAPTAPQSDPEYRPEWWHSEKCPLTAEERKKRAEDSASREGKPDWSNFLTCGIELLPRPGIEYEDPDPSGTFVLSWSTHPGAQYILQETLTDWSASTEIYKGGENRLVIYNRPPNDYFYRVRTIAAGASSDWSTSCTVRVGATQPWAHNDVKTYVPDTLLGVHRAAARMCAARGDLFAVLALPAHYREDDALAYADTFRLSRVSSADIEENDAPTAPELSYAALYHPWLITNAEGSATILRAVSPDGAVCGIMAKRARERGAWAAPANEVLLGAVALTTHLSAEKRLALQEARINLLRQEPRGFLVLDADTLSGEQAFRPIGVRRLLMLLRKAALRLGTQYVFEPNDKALRRSVERGFGAMLSDLHKRGAFKGTTASEAYQIVTDDTLNTTYSMDEGRFIAEIRVAPSLPMRFLTVRMQQSGEHISLVEGA